MTRANKIKVLFVCMGNICRSPAGEGIFQHYIETQSLQEQFFIDSAGTIAYHVGNRADTRMQEAATQRGYQLNSIARKVTCDDLQQFDLVVPMDSDNLM